ncbi:hypothetical protein BDU57DRAFT_573395 [Ampelomyces quisqualis]|uniref:Uncharacterized protein n=1 Tax=Ampelomyces quisqualis TaxID=50730 RepID=A0A6A5QKF1_AMPQU|nr:hypothetical protein BDU57DRAFT_573395 [Ampelomyces quisqualis]
MTATSSSSTAHKLSLEGVNARNLALVCRHFRATVEQTMYTHITLPQSTKIVQRDYAKSPLVYLVGRLLDRPHLARRTKSLHVWVRDRRLVRHQHERNYPPENPHSETFQRALACLSKFGLSFKDLFNWSTAMYEHQELALHAFLIALLPKLRELKLCAPMARFYKLADLGDHEMRMETKYSYLDVALRNSSITSAYIGGPFPIEKLPSATLTTLEFDIVFFGDRVDFLKSPLILPNVHTVSLVVNLRVLRSHTFGIICTMLDPRIGLLLFLRKVTPNIKHFNVAGPNGFMPYVNKPDNLVDAWGTKLPSEVDIEQEPVDIELNPLFNRLTDNNVWAWMLEALESSKTQLQTHKLPKELAFATRSRQTHPQPRPLLRLERAQPPFPAQQSLEIHCFTPRDKTLPRLSSCPQHDQDARHLPRRHAHVYLRTRGVQAQGKTPRSAGSRTDIRRRIRAGVAGQLRGRCVAGTRGG